MLGRPLLSHRSTHLVKSLCGHQSRAFGSREAPLPGLTNPVENAIAAAQQRGEFNNLHGAGKPLKQDRSAASRVPTGMSSADMLSQKAEFEMRRAIKNKELDHLQHGQKMEYKGTSIVSPSLSSGGDGGGDGPDAMSRYILEQAQPSASDLKSMK